MKLYKEASLMMLPTSVKDGKLYSIFPQPKPLSGELVTNGTFEDGSSWDTGTGWTISGGYALTDGTVNQAISQNDIATIGKKYRISFNITRLSSGTIDGRCWFGSSNPVFNFDSEGNYYFYLTANATNLRINTLSSNTASWSIDNISVVEVDQLDADFTFSRGSNLAATRINEQGLIEKGRENLLLQSNQFDTTWSDINASVTGGQTGYDGSSDAWSFFRDGTGGSVYLVSNSTGSGVSTFSIYAKAGDTHYLAVQDVGTSSAYAIYDVSVGNPTSGSVTTSSGSIIEKKIELVSGSSDWYRISFTANRNTSGAYRIYASSVTSLASPSNAQIYIQDAQVEVGLVATDYIESGATTGKAGVLEDLPRLNWGGNCPSLLLEPQRVNELTHSEYFEDFTETNNTTITTNAEISPEGLQNATKIECVGDWRLRHLVSSTVGNTTTVSVWVKAVNENEKNQFKISAGGGSNSSVFTATGQWQRFEFTKDNVTGGLCGISDYLNQDSDLYVWGMQVELGSYATSYIPTHGTSVTRSRDYASYASLGDLIGTGNCTFLFDFDFDVLTREGSGGLFRVWSHPDSFAIKGRSNIDRSMQLVVGSGFTNNVDIPSAANTSHKIIARVTGDVVEVFYNGTKLTDTMTGLSTYAWNELRIDATNAFQSKTKEISVFATALSDNECINLTTI